MFKTKTQLAGKMEDAEGTAETLTGADAILISNPSFKPNTPPVERDNTSQTMSQFAAAMGSRSATIGFDVELKGSGTPGTPPEWGKFLQACGFAETIFVSPASVVYLPTSTYCVSPVSLPSLTLALYMDGVRKMIWGARGDVSLKLQSGKFGVLSFTFTGADFSVEDVALLSSGVSYQATMPPVFANAGFSIDSHAAVLSSIDIKMANTVTLRESANSPSGYLSAKVTGRKPALSFDPEMVSVATYDFYGKLRSNNEGALSCVLGATPGNIVTITAPKVQYAGLNPADRGGINTLGIDCRLNGNTGDDELCITLT
jgi:hypothetical protein